MLWNRNKKGDMNSERSYSESKDSVSDTGSLHKPFGAVKEVSASTSAIE